MQQRRNNPRKDGRLRILVVPPSDWLHHPFATRLHYLFEQISKNHDVSVIEFTTSAVAAERKTGVNLLQVNPISSRGKISANLLSLPSLTTVLVRALKGHGFDAVVTSNVMPSLVASFIARLTGVVSVFDYHDHIPDSASLYYVGAKKRVVHRAVWMICLLSIKLSRRVVCSSDSLAEIVRREYGAASKIEVIPNGYDSQVFAPVRDREGLFEELAIRDMADRFLVVFAGSLEDRYDFPMVLTAIDALNKTKDSISLLIIGKGISSEYESRLRTQCAPFPFVKFIGYVPDTKKVAEYLNVASACIAPYKMMKTNFGLTLKLLEYLAVGKPVLVTPIRDVVEGVGDCVLVYGTTGELEAQLTRLSEDDSLCQTLGACGQNFVRNLSWDKQAQRYERVLVEAR